MTQLARTTTVKVSLTVQRDDCIEARKIVVQKLGNVETYVVDPLCDGSQVDERQIIFSILCRNSEDDDISTIDPLFNPAFDEQPLTLSQLQEWLLSVRYVNPIGAVHTIPSLFG